MDAPALFNADCLDILPALDLGIDAVVTDPPYGLSFMGKDWDHGIPGAAYWSLVLDAMKPGAHLLAFGGTRTHHRLMCAIEDAGFEIRDVVMWTYGTGFPKSLDISKSIDKTERNKWTNVSYRSGSGNTVGFQVGVPNITAPATDAAKQWDGWGTALKPAWEPITVARKPLDGTVAANVLEYGTGGINVDGCRIRDGSETGGSRPDYKANYGNAVYGKGMGGGQHENVSGRWPANLIHDGSEEVVELFPQTGVSRGGRIGNKDGGIAVPGGRFEKGDPGFGDSGSAARFFYCAKASKRERGTDNKHPTVKPVALMRYLCRLVTPPGGVILDPFMGSGSTGLAARAEGFRFIGIENDAESFDTAEARLYNNDAL